MKRSEDNELLEPIEEVTIEIDPSHAGWLMEVWRTYLKEALIYIKCRIWRKERQMLLTQVQ